MCPHGGKDMWRDRNDIKSEPAAHFVMYCEQINVLYSTMLKYNTNTNTNSYLHVVKTTEYIKLVANRADYNLTHIVTTKCDKLSTLHYNSQSYTNKKAKNAISEQH